MKCHMPNLHVKKVRGHKTKITRLFGVVLFVLNECLLIMTMMMMFTEKDWECDVPKSMRCVQ